MAVQPGLCRTWSETPKTGFLTTRLKFRGRQLLLGRLRPSSQLTSTKVLSQFVALTDAPCSPSISSLMDSDLGPIVQSIVSLTTLLRRQLVKYMWTTLSYTLSFFVEKMRIFCTTKDSHIFSTKNISVFVIFTFENLTKL